MYRIFPVTNNVDTMKIFMPAAMLMLLFLLPACSGKKGTDNQFPKDFNSLPDIGKVSYMMQHAEPDSVARFIIYASLGKIKGVTIDTISNATLHAYESYSDTDLQTFSEEFDRVSEMLPLGEKMKFRFLVGAEDPQGLGLTLGLEYMNQIREKKLSVSQVKAELAEMKKACASDPDIYPRFLIGFRTVLRYDRNADMPAGIYSTFLTYDEEAVQEYYKRNKASRQADQRLDSDSIQAPDTEENTPAIQDIQSSDSTAGV